MKKITAALRLILHYLQGQNTQSLSPSLTQTFTTTAKHGAIFTQHASKLGKKKRMPFNHVSGNVHHLFSIHFSLLWC